MYLCGGSHLYMFYPEMARKKVANALKMVEISIPPNSVIFIHCYMKDIGAGWGETQGLRYHICFILVRNILRDAIAAAYGRSLLLMISSELKVTASGSGHLSSCGCQSMDSDSESSDDDDMETDNGSCSNSNSQLGRFVVTDSFLNQ